MKIILSTRNPSKAAQIKEILVELSVDILTLSEVGIEGEAIENGTTLQENALKKALYAYERLTTKTWTMADDTGLFIEALNGEPGIRAARWAGEEATTEEIMQYTLKRLDGILDRAAVFETLVALVSPDGEQYFFSGVTHGYLLETPQIVPRQKMPYSAIFVPEDCTKVLAAMTIEEENKVSHRGKAFRQVSTFLAKMIDQ
ncbi:MAG: non-canonical purine NTP pyrophosphatase [bacterium]|nr:non-canonical purine NTP pyrophosphatase [bacterium]